MDLNPRTPDETEQSLIERGLLEKTPEYDQVPTLSKVSRVLAWRPSQWMKSRDDSSRPLGRTAYLDGLRGFAALLVYVLHHEIWAHSGSIQENSILEKGFGRDGAYYLVCFPGFRVFFSGGHFAVALFFIISGYVLSAKSLTLIHLRDTAHLADTLGSALFRRWLRLYIPVICTTFIWMTCWHVFNVKSSNAITATPEKTWLDDVWRWYCDFKNYSFIFNDNVSNQYNDHVWSIPLEFRGSIVVYTALMAASKCATHFRLGLEALLVWYFLYVVDGWYCALFAAGVLLCDLDLLEESGQLPRIIARIRSLPAWTSYISLGLCLYLGGVPAISDDTADLASTAGWHFLARLKPQAVYDVRWFFRFWGAVFAMLAVPRIGWLRGFFETTFCQYLGKVSFGLYLVHGPILWTIGDRVYAAVGRGRESSISVVPEWDNLLPLSGKGPFGLELNFLLPQLILLPLSLWMAELATRAFDQPSVRIAQWLMKRCSLAGRDARSVLS